MKRSSTFVEAEKQAILNRVWLRRVGLWMGTRPRAVRAQAAMSKTVVLWACVGCCVLGGTAGCCKCGMSGVSAGRWPGGAGEVCV